MPLHVKCHSDTIRLWADVISSSLLPENSNGQRVAVFNTTEELSSLYPSEENSSICIIQLCYGSVPQWVVFVMTYSK